MGQRTFKLLADCDYNIVMQCESEEKKAAWCSCIAKELRPREDPPCCFSDICKLGDACCTCFTHGKKQCVVPNRRSLQRRKKMIVSGSSCKDVSKQNTKFSSNRNVMEEERGTSGSTMAGLLRFAGEIDVDVVCNENVEDLADPSSANRRYVTGVLERAGIACDIHLYTADKKGARTVRPRSWMIGLEYDVTDANFKSYWASKATVAKMHATANSLTADQLSIHEYLPPEEQAQLLQSTLTEMIDRIEIWIKGGAGPPD